MKIEILEMIDGAKNAEGLTVIIDVFRAFSLEAHLFHAGADRIYAVGKEETARIMKMHHEDYILIGERGGKILPGFDYGNSPSQTEHLDLRGRRVIHTTSAGTQGLVNAVGASEILTGSLNNAKAIAEYIKRKNPEKVSLVAMGLAGKENTPEDLLCARYIKALLEGQNLDMQKEIEIVKNDPLTSKFFEPDMQEIFPEKDFYMCMDYDKFNFVLKVTKVAHDTFEVSKHII